MKDGAIGRVLEDVGFARVWRLVWTGSVWRETGEYRNRTSCQREWHGVCRVFQALEAERRPAMVQCAASMHTGHDPGAAVVNACSRQRNPAGQILLWLDKRVTVVLMPGKFVRGAAFFVNQLVPVQSDIIADEVA